MKIKLSKNKKIILLLSGFGILTTSIVIPIVVINNKNNNQEKNVEKINLLKNSNINNGNFGTIFHDAFGNLWAMGSGTKLQVLKVNDSKVGYVENWSNDIERGLLNGSNIKNGYSGTIFQDSFKNLWTMGYGTPLQVLEVNSSGDGYVNEGWTNDITEVLLNGSNIKNGYAGTIFQDSFKNLWTMGNNTKLQVLKANSSGDGYVSTGWTDDNSQGLLNESNITNGVHGTIFQDSFKNLWATGIGTKLQVLKVNSGGNGYVESWTDDTNQELLKNSNINLDLFGTIFQDKFKNLWAMGYGTSLQVLKVNSSGDGYVSAGWTDDNTQGLTNGSNIVNGHGGTIFQDSFGNLWAMGNGTKLQILKANSNGDDYVETWSNDNTQGLLNDSNIDKGFFGTIFQDSFKNLWAMGYKQKLQVLKANSGGNGYVESWTDDNTQGLTNDSNIDDGFGGTIFQDKFKNLWAMANAKPLQVLIANSDNTDYIDS